MSAPSFDVMVRDKGYITLGEAKQFAGGIPPEKLHTACGCYTCYSPACPGMCLGPSFLVNFCGCCLLYNPFMCACPKDTPGVWACTDMKGITYHLVPVDYRGTLAFFSEQELLQGNGDSLKVSCYCSKLC